MIVQTGSRDKLSAALRRHGIINRMLEKDAAKKLWARELMDNATRALQLGTSWQDQSPYKEELEQVRVSGDVRLDGTLIRQAIEAGTLVGWSELLKSDKLKTMSGRALYSRSCSRTRTS